ncbi:MULTISPECIES: carbohydrate ABC transporter permease [unclassified Paenibacillus]|uniref:carbohydrate ABC transporter permease n=1 Tax=unclassified Paenibacillus TaxID=185978 RepID=UPI0006FB47EB|nr:carbohydrate ABC transporter permease [Paenibacillus sp. Soil750]KRE69830.1 ABC transporter permease [Paenibacillus sp. Soil750]
MKATNGEKIFYAINYLVLGLIALTCILPFIHLIALSLSERSAVESGHVFFWPVGLELTAYKIFFIASPAWSAFKNSVLITVIGVVLSLLGTILAAYPLSRSYLIGRRYLVLGMVFTMLFSGGLIPTYLVIKNMHLIDSYWALWLSGFISTYNMLLMKSYFENIPYEVQEAARIDGCNDTSLLIRIILPLSLPMLATLALFYGIGFWNSFMNVLMYINKSEMLNLTVVVQGMLQKNDLLNSPSLNLEEQQTVATEMVKAVGVVVMVVPMLVVYPFLQKYFVKGVMLGSVKG